MIRMKDHYKTITRLLQDYYKTISRLLQDYYEIQQLVIGQ
jgi:hypothetical protein